MSAETCGLGAPDERDVTGVQLRGDPIGGRAGGAQRGDLGVVLDHAQRADDVDGPPERRLPDRCGSSSTRKRAHIWSPTATVDAAPHRPATISTGRRISCHGCSVNTSGCSTTRGASSRGTTSVASPSRGTTSIVRRSSGIA